MVLVYRRKIKVNSSMKTTERRFLFPILVKIKSALKCTVGRMQNRFFVEGAYKFSYNNGQVSIVNVKASMVFMETGEGCVSDDFER